MKATRSMVLVSSDPESLDRGALDVFNTLQQQIAAFGLEEEISLSMISDVSKKSAESPGA
jgi:hypothetical protein